MASTPPSKSPPGAGVARQKSSQAGRPSRQTARRLARTRDSEAANKRRRRPAPDERLPAIRANKRSHRRGIPLARSRSTPADKIVAPADPHETDIRHRYTGPKAENVRYELRPLRNWPAVRENPS